MFIVNANLKLFQDITDKFRRKCASDIEIDENKTPFQFLSGSNPSEVLQSSDSIFGSSNEQDNQSEANCPKSSLSINFNRNGANFYI